MPEITESIIINRPVEEVFAYTSSPENLMLWTSNLTAYEADSAIMEKGSRAKGTTRVAGKTVAWTSEVTEFEPNRHLVIRSLEAPMDFTIDYRYEDLGGTCKFTFHQDVGSLGGFFGKLADPLVTRMYSHDVRSNLAQLKELLEA